MSSGKKFASRILLVPHAGPKYSSRAMRAVSDIVIASRFKRTLVISTWHGGPINEEHSFEWMAASFADTELYSIINKSSPVIFAKPDDSEDIFARVLKTLIENPDTLVVFNSDLTHYGTVYASTDFGPAESARNKKIAWEKPLLDALSRGADVNEAIVQMPYTPCGTPALSILSRILARLGFVGEIADYYDSIDIAGRGDSFVSYVAMSFAPREYSVDFPSQWVARWSNIADCKNAIFLTLKSKYSGQSAACIGRTSNAPIGEKLREIAENDILVDLRSGRLGHPLDISEVYAEVVILSHPWYRIYNRNYAQELKKIRAQNSAGKWHGVRCTFSTIPNVSSIYIPDVWKERPELSIFDILRELSEKAGLLADSYLTSEFIDIFTEVGSFP